MACSQALYVPAPENVHDVDRIASLTKGRNLYIRHCGSCHNLYKPQTYSNEKWVVEMQEMKVEAKINDETAQQILEYLTGYKTYDNQVD